MQVSIRLIESGRLNRTLRTELYGWDRDCFRARGLSKTFPTRAFSRFLVLEVADVAAAACGLLKTSIEADGRPAYVTGLGGVIVRPEFQGRGYARRMVLEARKQASGTAALLAWCQSHLVDFWRGLGAQIVRGPVTILAADNTMTETPQTTLWFGDLAPETITVRGFRW